MCAGALFVKPFHSTLLPPSLIHTVAVSNRDHPTNVESILRDHVALIDQTMTTLLGEWQHAPDVIFLIHPTDGSLVVW